MHSPGPNLARRLLRLLVFLPALSLSAQNFLQPKVIPTGGWPSQVYAGDFDGDGNQDLLYLQFVPGTPAGQNDTLVNIVYGDGAGNFSAPVQQGSLNAAVSLTVNVADVNADGKTDMVYAQVTGPSSPISAFGVWFGSSGRTLQAPADYNTQGYPPGGTKIPHYTQIVAASENTYIANDPTLVVLDSINSYGALYTHTLGKLYPIFQFKLPDGAGPAVFTDVNGDGSPDLVLLCQQTGTIDVFLGNPFASPYGVPLRFAVAGIHSFLIKDVNNDGRPDLLAEGANGRISFYAGNGDGTFQTTATGATGTLDGLSGNGGHLIAFANRKLDGLPYALTATPAGISSLQGNTTGYLDLNGIYNAGPGHSSYAVADFNADGNLDLAVDSPEGIAILFGNPDGSFQSSRAFAAGQPAMSGALADFNNDGFPDAVVSTSDTQAQILLGNGAGAFTATVAPTGTNYPDPGLWGVVASRDFNGDGTPDLVTTADGPRAILPHTILHPGNGITVQFGNGDGTFQAAVNPMATQQFTLPDPSTCSPPFNDYPTILYGTSAFGDFNSDGIPDIANRDSSGYRILRGNNGSATSSNTPTPTLFFAGVDGTGNTVDCNPHAHDLVIAGDLNNDGIPDLIFQGQLGNSGSLLVNLTGAAGVPTLAGDLSVDGSLTSPGQLTAPALNATFNGPAIPVTSGGLGFPAFPGSAVIADLDRDGNNDVIVVYANLSANLTAPTPAVPNYIYIWFGDGTGHFPVTPKHPVNPVRLTPSRNFYQAAVADLNFDGIPDLILSDGYILSVQLGNGDGNFGNETHYLAGQGINSISVADINHDGILDLVLANGGAVLTNPVANLDILAANPDVNTGGITVLLNHATPAVAPVAPTTTLTSTPEPSTYGGSFSISATLTPPSTSNGIAPTGTVMFAIDNTLLGTAVVANSIATLAVPSSFYATLAAGVHTITASYSGDTNYYSAGLIGTHVVSAGTLTASPEPSVYLSPYTITATVPGTGSVVFSEDGTSLGTVTVVSGSASISGITSAAPGVHTLTAVWYANFNPLGITLTSSHTVTGLTPPTLTVSATPEPTIYSNAFSLIATFATAATQPTGMVSFSIDGNAIGSAPIIGSTAVLAVPSNTYATLAVGTHSLLATYSGDTNYNAGTATGTHTVTQLTTTTSLILCVDPPGSNFPCGAPLSATPLISPITMYYGQSIDGVAIESATNLSGTIVFYNGASIFCTLNANLSQGTNTCPTQSGYFPAGTTTVTAVYSGDSNDLPSTSNPIVVNVLPDPTTATVASSLNPSIFGQSVTFTANVQGNFAAGAGTVLFLDGTTTLYTATLDSTGSATFTTSALAVGTHPIRVAFPASANFNAATSATLNQVVNPATPPVNLSLNSSANPSYFGQSVTFTATANVGGTLHATGTVTFYDGTAALATVTLVNGVAAYTNSTLAIGSHPIVGAYSGSSTVSPGNSPTLNQVVTPDATTFSLTVSPVPVSLEIGHTAILLATVTESGGFSAPVQLTCSGLPAETACSFVQALIPAGGGATNLYLYVQAPHACGTGFPYAASLSTGQRTTATLLACLILLPFTRRRRRTRAILLSVVALLSLSGLSGCGNCTDLGVRPGSYTFTVTGSAQGVSATQSQLIHLNVRDTP